MIEDSPDVYKHYSHITNFIFIYYTINTHIDEKALVLYGGGEGESMCVRFPYTDYTAVPVSYTHLDVYKRQGQ